MAYNGDVLIKIILDCSTAVGRESGRSGQEVELRGALLTLSMGITDFAFAGPLWMGCGETGGGAQESFTPGPFPNR